MARAGLQAGRILTRRQLPLYACGNAGTAWQAAFARDVPAGAGALSPTHFNTNKGRVEGGIPCELSSTAALVPGSQRTCRLTAPEKLCRLHVDILHILRATMCHNTQSRQKLNITRQR